MKVSQPLPYQRAPMERLEQEIMLQINENLYAQMYITKDMYDHAKMTIINQNNAPREVHPSLGVS